ncbi:glycosyltransferase family 4 protein [Micrococcus sp.]|uniref:glycosyltransferase family 4 protein n=1 Tax=Micrococcus sp. TaxID=1271 RepID=UPI002A911CFA|nr:glycosyltransferase family 4 protein [Micrococcus sp.]MDY6054800.1 glycosyltransferase family 4 protein [Micrococcus sp.]
MSTRIWVAANQGEVGGGEVMLHHIATALRELGRDVAVVAPAVPAETADRLAADGFTVERVGGPGRAGYMRALRRWHRAHRDEVVWCNGLLPATALAGRGRRIVHLHQVPEKPQLRAFSAVARPGALAVLAPSRFAAERITGARVLPNWVPAPTDTPDAPRSRPSVPERPLQVGFLGRLSEDKGVLTLLEAAARLDQETPGAFRFLIAGESRFVPAPEQARIGEALARAGGAVELLGWQDTTAFLSRVDLLVVPSQWAEVFGLVSAEAMAAGVPVVVSDAGALPEVVGPDHPLTFVQRDVAGLVAALRRAAEVDRPALARAQHERWRERFSPEAGRAAVAVLLEDLHI